MKVKLDIPSAAELIKRKGLGPDGHVQRFHTANVNRRIGKYMPHLTGDLETKLKFTHGNHIVVLGPYAKYQYYGKVMVDSVTGKGPANIPDVGYRFRKGATLALTDRNLEYTKTFNPQAGPFWDRALVAAEGDALVADIQRYMERGR